jgi:membrane-associated protein
MIGTLQHYIHFIFNVKGLIEWGGTLLVCVIVFIETGFFVGFFLPGDSLLVTAGVFAATGQLDIAKLLLVVPLCAIAGDQIGYWIGRQAGQALYRREDSFIFRKRHLQRAHEFYEKYGGKTVILARFVPIVRTFCPPVAGAASMPYGRYIVFDVAGGFLWGGGMILGGYSLARKIPNIGEKIHYVIAVVIFLSLLPPIIGVLRAKSSGSTKPSAIPRPAASGRD